MWLFARSVNIQKHIESRQNEQMLGTCKRGPGGPLPVTGRTIELRRKADGWPGLQKSDRKTHVGCEPSGRQLPVEETLAKDGEGRKKKPGNLF
jgi:hypothetical protein